MEVLEATPQQPTSVPAAVTSQVMHATVSAKAPTTTTSIDIGMDIATHATAHIVPTRVTCHVAFNTDVAITTPTAVVSRAASTAPTTATATPATVASTPATPSLHTTSADAATIAAGAVTSTTTTAADRHAAPRSPWPHTRVSRKRWTLSSRPSGCRGIVCQRSGRRPATAPFGRWQLPLARRPQTHHRPSGGCRPHPYLCGGRHGATAGSGGTRWGGGRARRSCGGYDPAGGVERIVHRLRTRQSIRIRPPPRPIVADTCRRNSPPAVSIGGSRGSSPTHP